MDRCNQEKEAHHVQTTAADNGDVAIGNNTARKDSINGIDIRQALEILSSRTPHSHDDHSHSHKHGTPCCGNGTDKPPPDVLKNMGQTIRLFAPSPSPSVDSALPSSKSETTPGNHAVDPEERRKKIRETLKDLPIIALVKMVLTAQQDRVRTYGLYDEALAKVLISNRLTDYPRACVAATAAFSVLSDTVVAVRDELSNRQQTGTRKKKDGENGVEGTSLSSVIDSINDLQSSEREKLQLTAAYHLEQIRANNAKDSNTTSDDDDTADADRRELLLLKKGIASMRSRIETCRSNINDVMEDLRCALVDLMDED